MPAKKSGIKKLRGLAMNALPMMMTCRELEEFMVDYLEGNLSARQHRKFEMHLRLCRECRRYLDAYSRTIDLSRWAFQEPDGPIPEDFPQELLDAIVAARQQRR